MNGINNFTVTDEILLTGTNSVQALASTNLLNAEGKSNCHKLILNNWLNTFPWAKYVGFWNNLTHAAISTNAIDRNDPRSDFPYDSEVEYVHFGSMQEIILPMTVNEGDTFELSIEWEQISTVTGKYILYADPNPQAFYTATYRLTDDLFTFSSNVSNIGNVNGVGNGYTIYVNKRQPICISDKAKQDRDFQRPITMGWTSLHIGNSGANAVEGKLYKLTCIHNDIVIFDLIPVRIGNVGYLYNRIDKTLYGQEVSGAGDLTVGEDVGPNYDSRVEYIYTISKNNLTLPLDINTEDDYSVLVTFKPTRYIRYGYLYWSAPTTLQFACRMDVFNGDPTPGPDDSVTTDEMSGDVGWIPYMGKVSTCAIHSKLNAISTFFIHTNGKRMDCNGTHTAFIKPITEKQTQIRFCNGNFIGNIYHISIYHNDELVYDLTPVRKSNIGYMYDRISRKLFGSGAANYPFSTGPDVKFTFDERLQYLTLPQGCFINTHFNCIDNSAKFTIYGSYGSTDNLTLCHSPLMFTRSTLASKMWRIDNIARNNTCNVYYHKARNDVTKTTVTLSEPERKNMVFGFYIALARNYINVNGVKTTLDITYDNVAWSTAYLNSFPTDGNPVCLGLNDQLRIFRFTISVGSNVVHDYVPIKIDTIGYLYDIVTGEILSAEGTDFSICGPYHPIWLDYYGSAQTQIPAMLDYIPLTTSSAGRFTIPVDFCVGDRLASEVELFVNSTDESTTNKYIWWVSGSNEFRLCIKQYVPASDRLYCTAIMGGSNNYFYIKQNTKSWLYISDKKIISQITKNAPNRPVKNPSVTMTINGHSSTPEGKLYRIYIEQNGHPLYDLIPVLYSNGQMAVFYDRITGVIRFPNTQTFYALNNLTSDNILPVYHKEGRITPYPYELKYDYYYCWDVDACIDLTTIFEDTDTLEFIGSVDKNESYTDVVFTSEGNSSTGGMQLGFSITENRWAVTDATGIDVFREDLGGLYQANTELDFLIHRWVYSNGEVSITDIGIFKSVNIKYSTYIRAGSIKIFPSNFGEIHSLKQIKDNKLIHDLYPIALNGYGRKSNNTWTANRISYIGMYDRITGKIIYPANNDYGDVAEAEMGGVSYSNVEKNADYNITSSWVPPLTEFHKVSRIIDDYTSWEMHIVNTGVANHSNMNNDYLVQKITTANSSNANELEGMLTNGSGWLTSSIGINKISDIIKYSTINCTNPTFNNINLFLLHIYVYISLVKKSTDVGGLTVIPLTNEIAVGPVDTSYLHIVHNPNHFFNGTIEGSVSGYNYLVLFPIYYMLDSSTNRILVWIVKISRATAITNPTGNIVNLILGQLTQYTTTAYVYCVAVSGTTYYILCSNK